MLNLHTASIHIYILVFTYKRVLERMKSLLVIYTDFQHVQFGYVICNTTTFSCSLLRAEGKVVKCFTFLHCHTRDAGVRGDQSSARFNSLVACDPLHHILHTTTADDFIFWQLPSDSIIRKFRHVVNRIIRCILYRCRTSPSRLSDTSTPRAWRVTMMLSLWMREDVKGNS